MRRITEIIVHCSATREGKYFTAEDIDRWHKAQGFACIGLLLLPFVFWLILAFGGAQYKDGSYTNTQPDMVEDVVNKAKDVVSGNHSNNEENNQ